MSGFIAPDPSTNSYLNVPFDVISTGGYFTTAQITDTFTFTYTPAAAVAATPEPESLGLLATGLLAGSGVWRRRRLQA